VPSSRQQIFSSLPKAVAQRSGATTNEANLRGKPLL
jgi:hypothetical protein